jgi:hypothetical protein
MGRRGPIALSLLAVAAMGAVGWLARPQPCDFGVDGGFSLAAWPGNVLARLAGAEEDCDPWARLATGPFDGPIEVRWSINAYAGPVSDNILFQPDGTVAVWRDDFTLEDARAQAVILHDPALYALAVERLSPMRGWTQPSIWDEIFDSLFDSLPPRSQVHCESDGYHSGLTIMWGGSPYNPLDISYIKTDGGVDCPPEGAALARYSALQEGVANRLVEGGHEIP